VKDRGKSRLQIEEKGQRAVRLNFFHSKARKWGPEAKRISTYLPRSRNLKYHLLASLPKSVREYLPGFLISKSFEHDEAFWQYLDIGKEDPDFRPAGAVM
jgi:hypothetical protein